MNVLITLDYELFFGSESGTVENCIIKPTKKLLEIVAPYQIKLVFFVDVGYIIKLKEFKSKFPELEKDYTSIVTQIQYLAQNNHGIELHIHPHWEDSYYNGKKWIFNTSRYALTAFSNDEVIRIFKTYSSELEKISGVKPKVYRAGGWSAQPFSKIKSGLETVGVFTDSTVYPKGYYKSKQQSFDFRNVPLYTTKYTFNENLTTKNLTGLFTEIPISSYKVSPVFFWKFALKKLYKNPKHHSFGDGFAISKSKKEVFRLLLKPSYSVVSIDGYKASYLERAFKKYIKNTTQDDNFVIIGHPKAFSEYSLKKTKEFISKNVSEHPFITFDSLS